MKKFFALLMVAVLAMATFAFADEQIKGEDNGALDLSAYADGTLVVTFKCSDASKAQAGWGVGGLCIGGWDITKPYEALLAAEPTADEVLTVEWNIAEVKAAAAGKEINVNFYNGYALVKVEVRGAVAAGDATPVAAMAIVAMVACAAMVVLRKKEA